MGTSCTHWQGNISRKSPRTRGPGRPPAHPSSAVTDKAQAEEKALASPQENPFFLVPLSQLSQSGSAVWIQTESILILWDLQENSPGNCCTRRIWR